MLLTLVRRDVYSASEFDAKFMLPLSAYWLYIGCILAVYLINKPRLPNNRPEIHSAGHNIRFTMKYHYRGGCNIEVLSSSQLQRPDKGAEKNIKLRIVLPITLIAYWH